MDFKGKVFVVTGGGGAIGATITRRLMTSGAQIIWTDIDPAAELRADDDISKSARFFHQDVGDPAGWAALEVIIRNEFGRLDGLVNNAGIYRRETIEQVTLESLRNVMRINFEGALLGCQMAFRLMKESGAIVNIGSVAALRPGSQSVSYGASKAALLNLTQSVARYAIDKKIKIRCNAISPGGVESAMSEKALLGVDPAVLDRQFKSTSVQGRMAKPDEIASMAVFLLSSEADFATGANYVVDGGLML